MKWLKDIKNPYELEFEDEVSLISNIAQKYYAWQECMDTVTKAYHQHNLDKYCPTCTKESRAVEFLREIYPVIVKGESVNKWYPKRGEAWAKETGELLREDKE